MLLFVLVKLLVEPGNTTLGNSTVNITLVDPETGEPIPNAPVIITLPDGTEVPAVTDENGTVEVPVDLPVGPSYCCKYPTLVMKHMVQATLL